MNIEQTIENIRPAVALLDVAGTEALGAWFLGPRGESQELLSRLVTHALEDASITRRISYPEDPSWADTTSPAYKREAQQIETHLLVLLRRLARYSIPWYSYRYQAHMNWDNALPAVAAYFGAMLYNQNNVAAEGSPVTTALEIEAARDLCRMLGYGNEAGVDSWGHITCDGSVANIEALWAARNVKLYPFAVWHALNTDEVLKRHRDFEVQVTGGSRQPLAELSWWELLNLSADETLELPDRLLKRDGIAKENLAVIKSWTVQHLGLGVFASTYDELFSASGKMRSAIESLAVLAPASVHYSVPKAATLLGLGSSNVVPVKIGPDARMDIEELKRKLDERFAEQRPVMVVVAVIGSTQESAVDELSRVLELRGEYRKKGFDFLVHADAAWGGYFASLLRKPATGSPADRFLTEAIERARVSPEQEGFGPALAVSQLDKPADSEDQLPAHERLMFVPEMGMNKHAEQQIRSLGDADTVTIDPHKSGFVPYPAGALCYRNRKMPEMVQITAPVVYHEGVAKTVGVFGIEGSKPGAAAASVWFSHRIIRPDQSGYGKVLGRCIFNAKRFYAALTTMKSPYFKVATLQQLQQEDENKVLGWLDLDNKQLWVRLKANPDEESLFRNMGPDLNILTYALNLKLVDPSSGRDYWNEDPKVANEFNDKVFRALSLESEDDDWPPVVITGSQYENNVAGGPVKRLRDQLGVTHDQETPMKYLISTIMNPWMSDADGGKRNMAKEVAGYLQHAIEAEVMKFRKGAGDVES